MRTDLGIILVLYLIGWVASSAQMQTYGRNKPNVNAFRWVIGGCVLGGLWPAFAVVYISQRTTDVIDAWGNGQGTP